MKAQLHLIWMAVMVVTLLGSLQTARAYYDPGVQRWLNRDPINDRGFQASSHNVINVTHEEENLYCFVKNNAVDGVDYLGLKCKIRLHCSYVGWTPVAPSPPIIISAPPGPI